MRINSNASALFALQSLNRVSKKSQLSSERLSSGIKIRSAAQGASDVAIANKLRNQSIGLNTASQNASIGISIVQTADGAFNQINDMLQRIRELAVYASNDTQTADDRTKMQMEVNQLLNEIDSIANKTEYNNIKLLGGFASRIISSLDADVLRISDTIPSGTYEYQVTQKATKTTLTSGTPVGTVPNPNLIGSISINGVDVTLNGGETQTEIFEKLRTALDYSGFTITAGTSGNIFDTMESIHFGSKYNLNITGSPQILNALGLSNSTFINGTDVEITFANNTSTPPTSLTTSATYTSDGNRVFITDMDRRELVFDISPGLNTNTSAYIDIDKGPIVLHLGPSKDMNMSIDIPKISTATLNIDKLNVNIFDHAQEAIDISDNAISYISNTRARIGAYQNRLEYSILSLDNTALNTDQSLSRIQDTDMALEMTNYSKYSIISQAALSILSQANQMPQSVLQLIQF